ncbi:hypothetical protein AK88_01920 [Plasmodium fragile]|uniref:Uncharacterized protein n=1 Tax=Plasmodium fragile TaxID=5857 RepID=A0A0D9QNF2_PLAFR|nr:uncharacterized protein AK88_01920 [Plasmodium fragile]KJP88468.1 hypothetical protein AK88_01920 [Plasmodium fragile]
MRDHLNNKSQEYQKLLLSASIRREAKQNEENNDAKNYSCGKSHNNNFILYMEFKFENIILSRYLFDIRDELGTPIRNSVQITRFIIMRSDNHIMGTCVSNRVILCYRNDKETKTILHKLKEELKRKYFISLTDERNEDTNGNEIDKSLLSYIIQFTLVCKYIESGKWVHIWDNMNTIVESKFCGNNSSKYFNCIGFKFDILNTNYKVTSQKKNCIHLVQMHLKVMLSMYKILPVVEEQICEHMFVYCLPRCSMRATILNVQDISDATVEKQNFNYKDYWLHVHGYVLNQNALKKIVKVRLYKGVFNYPQGVLLRDNIYKLNIPIKNEPFFYVCQFLSTFELLKKAQMNLLKWSQCDDAAGNNIYDDLFLPHNSIGVRKEQGDGQDDSEFYSKLNRICKHQFEGNNFSQSISQSNKVQKTYDNSYHMYGNTLTTSGVSINLDFSKNKKSGNGKDSCNSELDTFLKESALAYYARHANPFNTNDLTHKNKQQDTTVVHIMDNQHRQAAKTRAQMEEAYTVGNPHQSNNQLDTYLHNVAKSYNSVEENNADHMTEVSMLGKVNPQIIFSKDFENFLDNLDEAALYQQEPLLTQVNFDQREGKRPNFPMTSPPLGQQKDYTQGS